MDSLSLLNQQELPTLGSSDSVQNAGLGSTHNSKNYNPSVKVDAATLLHQIKDQFDTAYTDLGKDDKASKLTNYDSWVVIMLMADNVFKQGKLHTEMKHFQDKVLLSKSVSGSPMTEGDLNQLNDEMDKFIAQAKNVSKFCQNPLSLLPLAILQHGGEHFSLQSYLEFFKSQTFNNLFY